MDGMSEGTEMIAKNEETEEVKDRTLAEVADRETVAEGDATASVEGIGVGIETNVVGWVSGGEVGEAVEEWSPSMGGEEKSGDKGMPSKGKDEAESKEAKDGWKEVLAAVAKEREGGEENGKPWVETGGEVEWAKKYEKALREWNEAVEGLAKCPVCGEAARVRIFGVGGKGVWVGCDRSAECVRNLEFHTEGWSVDEAMHEWNRLNRGVLGAIRRVKGMFRRAFGEGARYERRRKRERRASAAETDAKRRENLGVGKRKRVGLIERLRWWRIRRSVEGGVLEW